LRRHADDGAGHADPRDAFTHACGCHSHGERAVAHCHRNTSACRANPGASACSTISDGDGRLDSGAADNHTNPTADCDGDGNCHIHRNGDSHTFARGDAHGHALCGQRFHRNTDRERSEHQLQLS
jgi:hypothetical protein